MEKQFGTTLFFEKKFLILRNFIANNPAEESEIQFNIDDEDKVGLSFKRMVESCTKVHDVDEPDKQKRICTLDKIQRGQSRDNCQSPFPQRARIP